MAIDMTTVKQIIHNNKEVAKIEDSLGNILWQKQSPASQVTISFAYKYDLIATNINTTSTYWNYIFNNNTNYVRHMQYSQLETLTAGATSQQQSFVFLTASQITAINNQLYTTNQTVGVSHTTWAANPTTYYCCVVYNNKVYAIGNSTYPTTNDSVLGSSEGINLKTYYPFAQSNYTYNGYTYVKYMVNLINSSSTGTSVTRWRCRSDWGWVNHTNGYTGSNRNAFVFCPDTVDATITYQI